MPDCQFAITDQGSKSSSDTFPCLFFLFLTVGLDILKLISIFVSMVVFFSVCRVTQSNHMSSRRKFASGIEKGLLDEIDIDTIITNFASRTVIRNYFK